MVFKKGFLLSTVYIYIYHPAGTTEFCSHFEMEISINILLIQMTSSFFVIYGQIERILMDIYIKQMTYILRKRNKILKFLQGVYVILLGLHDIECFNIRQKL